MSIVTEAPHLITATPAGRSHLVALRLGWVEGRHLARRPIIAFGSVLSVATYLVATWNTIPVLHQDDVLISMSLLPLAGATFLAANIATTRSRRTGAEETFAAAPARPESRTSAHLFALAWPFTIGVLLALAAVAYSKIEGVWAPSAKEVATGPVLVAVFGAAGVLVGRIVPSALAGSVGLLGLAAIEIYFSSRSNEADAPLRWAAFWVPQRNVDALGARETLYLPAGWHLLYLAGLAAAAGAAARLRHGARPMRLVALLAVSTVAAFGVWGQSHYQEKPLRPGVVAAREPIVCQTRGGVRYCAYRAYEPLIGAWSGIVDSVFARAPRGAVRSGLEVHQVLAYIEEPSAERTAVIHTTPKWGRRFRQGYAELAIASRAASWAVGFPAGAEAKEVPWDERSIREFLRKVPNPPPGELPKPGDVRYSGPCLASEGRAVIALWLAARASPHAENALRKLAKSQPYGIVTLGGDGPDSASFGFSSPEFYLDDWQYVTGSTGSWSARDVAYVIQLLDRPQRAVEKTVVERWAELTHPTTMSDEVAATFGLRRVPTIEEQMRAAGVDPVEVGIGVEVPSIEERRCP